MNNYKLFHYTLYLNQYALQSHFFITILLEKGFCTLSEVTTKGFYKNQTLLTLD